MKQLFLIGFFFILFGWLYPSASPSPSFAQTIPTQPPQDPAPKLKHSRWGVEVFSGFYRPRLKTLNTVISNPRLGILQDPNFLLPGNEQFQSNKKNIVMDDLSGNVEFGVELNYDLSQKSALFLSTSLWHGQTINGDIIPIPIFARPTPAHFVSCVSVPVEFDYRCASRSARYNLVLEQFWAGWRYLLYEDSRQSRIYADLGLFGISLAFLTMDSSVRLVSDNLNFASVSSTEAMGWGYSSRVGVKGEYFLSKNFSFGGGIRYIVGDIKNLAVTRYFPAGFQEFLSPQAGVPNANTAQFPPPPPKIGDDIIFGQVTTTSTNNDVTSNIEKLAIEVDGFSLDLFFKIYF
ncbi:MAG: hypothetical protein HY036_04325 [Nitrospirae bacterium]|nr:hypothetical protein [Nitrospirota bacterium]MBI3351785.1 hypothetical protein [Nitrospirota bacterium]